MFLKWIRCLDPRLPAGSTVWEGCGAFKRRSLTVGTGFLGDCLDILKSSPTSCPLSALGLQSDQPPQISTKLSLLHQLSPFKLQAKINACLPFVSGFWSDIWSQKQGEKLRPCGSGGGCSPEPLTHVGSQPSLTLPGNLPFVSKTKEQALNWLSSCDSFWAKPREATRIRDTP